MPVRERRPEDDRPLFRAVNEQRLIRPAGPMTEDPGTPGGEGEAQTSSQTGTDPVEKGPIARAVDRAQENNWVYPFMANKAREKGLLDKADELLNRVKAQLGSG